MQITKFFLINQNYCFQKIVGLRYLFIGGDMYFLALLQNLYSENDKNFVCAITSQIAQVFLIWERSFIS